MLYLRNYTATKTDEMEPKMENEWYKVPNIGRKRNYGRDMP